MKFIIFFWSFVMSGYCFGALTEADFAEFEISDEVHSELQYKLTVSEVRDEEHLKELLKYYSSLIPKKDKANVMAVKAFYPIELATKYKLPENKAIDSLDTLWEQNFSELKLEEMDLGERSLDELYNERSPSSTADSTFNAFKKSEVRKAKNFFRKNFRMSLSFFRGGLLGTVSAGVFMVSGMPIAPATIMGTVIGSMSGGIQYHIGVFSDFFETNKYTGQLKNYVLSKFPFLEQLGFKKVSDLGRKSSNIKMLAKWFLTEVAFVGIIESALSVMTGMDWIVYYQSFWSTFYHSGVSSFLSVATQGVWETAVVKEFNPKLKTLEGLIEQARARGQLNRLANLEDLHHSLLVKRAAMFVYGSVTSVSAVVLKTLGLKIHGVMFASLGASGLVNHARVYLKGQKNWFQEQFKRIPGVCKRYTR